MGTLRKPRSRASAAIAVALEPREIDALIVAAHMVMDSLPADDQAVLERATWRLRRRFALEWWP
jgi:hypothetical protein